MPQVLAVWCEAEGHDVFLAYHNSYQTMTEPLPEKLDVVFISSFTQSAQVAYALSNLFRTKGALTVLGGPHARSYPEDTAKYFDYVLGFTDQQVVNNVLQDLTQHRPLGMYLSATQQPKQLPGVRQRWKYIDRILQKAPWLKMVAAIGSFGCPYTCHFCTDSTVPYQPLDFEEIKADLRFLLKTFKSPIVAWHDPNFGVRFNDYLSAIEEAAPPGSIRFIAESSLSLLNEDNIKRLKKNGFLAILPGIESWYEMGYKTRAGKRNGLEKVHQVADQINTILGHLSYLQSNLILGLDCDYGSEPFELTKHYLDLTPGNIPGFSVLTSFGRSAPVNLEYQRQNRILPIPFHFLNNNTMNIRPKHYTWIEFYNLTIDLREYAFSYPMIYKRVSATKSPTPKLIKLFQSLSDRSKVKYLKEVRRRLEEDKQFCAFFEQETEEIPVFFVEQIKKDLGPLWEWLPEGALYHDAYAYLKTENTPDPDLVRVSRSQLPPRSS
ncbi:radical SAM protein [Synechococcus sp. PCC 7336]|uniref:B12-binding domain-containing radical SAM protein n=1 Tax=Synechococcus sp. PCC 7336 TaxID=195250 RepID=UPI00187DBBAA|nr:radical SAM protein [Synechococcus sp. PCC 7336]